MDTTSLAPPTSVRPRSLRGSRPENEKHGAQTRAVLPSVIVSVKLVVRSEAVKPSSARPA